MKQVKLLSFLVALILTGCSSMDPPNHIETSRTAEIRKISIDEAIEIAYNMNSQFSEISSRALPSISKQNVKAIKGRSSRSNSSDTLLYVINFDDNKGFAVVAASNIDQPQIAFIPKGNYDPNQPSDVKPFEAYMQLAAQYVEEQNTSPRTIQRIVELQPVTKGGWDDTIYYSHKKPALKISWGQEDFYGQFCPNKVSGCAPTALAMFIAHRNFSDLSGQDPTTAMIYTYPSKDKVSETVHWKQIYRHLSASYTDQYNINHSEVCLEHNKIETHKTIARIMRQIGHEVETSYYTFGGPNGSEYRFSGTTPDKIYPYIKKVFPYYRAQDFRQYNLGDCEPWINRSGICFMSGLVSPNEGHIWLCDGYFHSHIIHYVPEDLLASSSSRGPLELVRYVQIEEEQQYLYFKWGWDGKFDGQYYGKVFTLVDNSITPKKETFFYNVKYLGTSPY